MITRTSVSPVNACAPLAHINQTLILKTTGCMHNYVTAFVDVCVCGGGGGGGGGHADHP